MTKNTKYILKTISLMLMGVSLAVIGVAVAFMSPHMGIFALADFVVANGLACLGIVLVGCAPRFAEG